MDGIEAEDRLRSIQLLTDVALTQLDVEAFLVELLDRVRDTVQADTAAVLLLEPGGQELAARAARGIEEEVYQDVRIPLRTGFAGRIAAERGPVLLDRVDDTTVANPILWERGIRAMLGVPLLVGDRLIGVLHVGRLSERPFTTDDVELLQLVAERVASRPRPASWKSNGPRPDCWNEACCRAPCPAVLDSRSPSVTPRQKVATWGATGMTCSYSRPASCGSSPVTSPATVWPRRW